MEFFSFFLPIFYLLGKSFNQSGVPQKIGCINGSWRAGGFSACSILFLVFWISFDATVLRALMHLATWISGAYSCEGQFSASCQVFSRGDVAVFILQIPSCRQSCRHVPSSASCLCSLGLLHGWAGLLLQEQANFTCDLKLHAPLETSVLALLISAVLMFLP